MVDNEVEILRSGTFDRWLRKLKDGQAVARILARIDRLALGNSGDAKSVGGGVFELRIDHGPGYRVYFAQRGQMIILLLCGGDKSTQGNDISTAQGIAAEWRNDG
jgi:putative addiction module killer protein